MAVCRAENLQFKYPGQIENLLTDISFTIGEEDRIGLIGRNGSGKSTLFSLVRGDLRSTGGTLQISESFKVGYLPQEIRVAPGETVGDYLWGARPDLLRLKRRIAAIEVGADQGRDLSVYAEFADLGGYEFESRVDQSLQSFGFDPPDIGRDVEALSGGEKTKVGLARVLLSAPDLLLLDEPTNHIDIESLVWLEGFLRSIRKPFVVISHDRRFLDRTVCRIFEIERGRFRDFSGNYSFYEQQKGEEFNRKLEDHQLQQKKIKQLKRAAASRKQWAFTHQPETRAGRAAIYESQVNSAKTVMKQAINIQRRIEREIEKEEAKKPFIEKQRSIKFLGDGVRNKVVLRAEGVLVSYGSRTVLDGLNLVVENGERLCITGPNGSGKTTFLKVAANLVDAESGSLYRPPGISVGYFDQESAGLDPKKSALEELLDGDRTFETKVRTILGSLNLGANRIAMPIGTLSLGERSKVALAKIIFAEPDLLLLDEPTNHLEISARKNLENALVAYRGTIIFVSHDRAFREVVATRSCDVGPKEVLC